MSKPLGIFTSTPNRPPWVQFALLPDWQDFDQAAEDSRRTGIKWVLGIYSTEPATPLSSILPGLDVRLHRADLLPHIVGMCYAEEWYGRWKSGQFHIPGLDPANPAHLLTGARSIAWWVSEQHKAMKAAINKPIVWVDTFVNDDPAFGGTYYQPVPWGVDVLALEAYVPAQGSWAADVEPFLQHAVATRTEPISLVVQGFAAAGDPLWHRGITDDGLAGTAQWMQHPRVISGWVFDWASRANLTGLCDLPGASALLHALGVR